MASATTFICAGAASFHHHSPVSNRHCAELRGRERFDAYANYPYSGRRVDVFCFNEDQGASRRCLVALINFRGIRLGLRLANYKWDSFAADSVPLAGAIGSFKASSMSNTQD